MSIVALERHASPSNQMCFSWMNPENVLAENESSTYLPGPIPRTSNRSTQRALPANGALRPVSVDRHSRVGEAKLGNVMLALLKRYGITDEEISAELSAMTGQ